MKRITALPIKGESYLLEYVGKRVLVDGGYTGAALAPVLKKQLGGPNVHLDVVVCTHSDNDHAAGLTTLLDQPGITASEFWLPGSWKESVKELVEETELFYKGLVKEIKDVDGDHIETLSAEENEKIDCELAKLTSDVLFSDEGDPGGTGCTLELRPAKPDTKTTSAAKAKQSIRRAGKAPAITRRAMDLIDTAERIRKIAVSVNDKGVPVRWFDYLAYSKDRIATGGEDFLTPVNAKELREPPTLSGFALRRFIALSRANRESIVFLSSGDDAHVDVMFCGDSPMGDGPRYANSFLSGKRTHGPLIATVPHHGADSNVMAYGHIAGFGSVSFWIRAGGKPHHPQSAYRAIPGAMRTCTHCPHNRLPLQAVCITDKYEEFTDPQAWLTVRSHDCLC
ncbi:MBL fold metallo-hydrolase [Burkholderia cenocepacia]|uniref:MBL fold metallo-hydrolase n=4 Tax=Burkholderia cenocepacia TaxID=95486 RepID=UPI00098225D8|nr:MBL fold metallo-hydrolase [Burkholderia cenocepacia]MBR8248462.1 MBL fold metallo-hydrolase [Burkholderia cenocepacia]USB84888.1 MBL fold metallo-hydrolase [Burkholderia cenocepacia]